jgi:hypothetical protein
VHKTEGDLTLWKRIPFIFPDERVQRGVTSAAVLAGISLHAWPSPNSAHEGFGTASNHAEELNKYRATRGHTAAQLQEQAAKKLWAVSMAAVSGSSGGRSR